MVLVISYVFVILTILSMDLRISQATSRATFHESSVADYHQQWMIQFSRVYSNESEKQMRLKVFEKNLKFIENFNNNENHSYKLGVNEFTDLTQEEFLATHTGLNGVNLTSLSEVVDKTMPSWNWNVSNVVAASKDWTMEGAVTPVKAQGQCGGCWAFVAIATVEALTRISRGKLMSLSEQQLIDCNKINDGCSSGRVPEAYEYIIRNGGVTTDLQYPYQVKVGTCRSNTGSAMQISGFQTVPENNERALLEAVSRQPVAVLINERSFMHYSGGVFDAPDCGISVSHAVTLVGYGTTKEGIKYWLAKNSWGTTWGEKGYIRLRRDVEWPEGMCGLAQWGFYPVA